MNVEKCVSECDSIKFLGYIFSAGKITPNPDLASKIANASRPSSLKELESFLGLANFYGRFIPNFAVICAPLYELKSSKLDFEWSESCQSAFETLKNHLVSEPVLRPFQRVSILLSLSMPQ